jgi:hypothetical protein
MVAQRTMERKKSCNFKKKIDKQQRFQKIEKYVGKYLQQHGKQEKVASTN